MQRKKKPPHKLDFASGLVGAIIVVLGAAGAFGTYWFGEQQYLAGYRSASADQYKVGYDTGMKAGRAESENFKKFSENLGVCDYAKLVCKAKTHK